MALTNIELYEELKKTVTEDAARMIAEVVPKAGDLATRADVARIEARIEVGFAEMKGHIDSRFFRYTATVVIPMCALMLGALITLIVK